MRVPSVHHKPDGYPEQADITNRESIIDYLKRLESYYTSTADKVKDLLSKMESSEIGPGRPAVHREYGNCFVTKIWPKAKKGKLQCAITFTPKEPQNKGFMGRSNNPGNAVVDITELMPYNDMSKTLYEE